MHAFKSLSYSILHFGHFDYHPMELADRVLWQASSQIAKIQSELFVSPEIEDGNPTFLYRVKKEKDPSCEHFLPNPLRSQFPHSSCANIPIYKCGLWDTAQSQD
jgi:hypothetical protein